MAQPINELQSGKTQDVLDLLSKLKGCAITKKINIPEIVTIGDQDAGKSKVLSAICGISFPSEGGKTCTSMATRIDLRRGDSKAIVFELVPNPANAAGLEKAQDMVKLYNSKGLKTLAKLADIQTKIHTALGVGLAAKAFLGFSKHTLRIEIQGPDKPMLSLVDLPGIIQSPGPGRPQNDVKVIRDIAASHVKNPSAIILAIMSAGHDFQSQSARAVIEEHKAAERSMLIITKPDCVGEEEIEAKLKVADDVAFGYGWHVLMNKYDGPNFTDRDREEQRYFDEKDVWADYRDGQMLGAPELRGRLSEVLANRLSKDLPGIVTKLRKIATDATASLEALGPAVEDLSSRTVHLVEVSERFQKIASDAEAGRYGHLPMSEEKQTARDALRLRAALEDETNAFVTQMHRYGIKYNITGIWTIVGNPTGQQMPANNTAYATQLPENKGRDAAIAWVEKKHRISRGQELPGRFNPGLIKDIFDTLSENWTALSSKYLERVHVICREILESLIRKSARPEIAERLIRHRLYPALRDKRAVWSGVLAQMQDIAMKQEPKTKDPGFWPRLERLQHDRTEHLGEYFLTRQTPDTLAALGALDESMAYYDTRLTFFLDVVTSIVVEAGLLENLVNSVLTPTIIVRMDAREIDALAGEDALTAAKRTRATKTKAEAEEVLSELELML